MANKNDYLQDLITQAEALGGVTLRIGQTSRAVVLSIDKYNELLSGKPGLETSTDLEGKVLVVLGSNAGFGVQLAIALHEAGVSILVFGEEVTAEIATASPEILFVKGSATEEGMLKAVLEGHDITTVLYVGMGKDTAPLGGSYLSEEVTRNLISVASILKVMENAAVRNLVLYSTGEVYGTSSGAAVSEDLAPNPVTAHGSIKLQEEKLAELYARHLGFKIRVLRFGVVCGFQKLVSTRGDFLESVIEAAAGKSDRVLVHGNTHQTFDGTLVRDYIHWKDAAEACMLAVASLDFDAPFSVYNVSSGKGSSEERVVSTATEVLNRMMQIEIGEQVIEESPVLDITRARSELGFLPKHSDLETIIRAEWDARQVG